MKKQYTKPEIMFEDFSLTENIASGCEIIVPTPNGGTCGYKYEGGNGSKMFTNSVGDCDVKVDDDEKNGFCYHDPISNNNLFNS